ncbi:hypothetical protein [Tepidanaerobacter acetatoxydans]|nr:hypothetical protein [Tepidanaerobacter acetatoxydans]AEE91017.1 hypothetical protein TepRe1_0838 [Tepidanaerobacter acetatoxydans Re1]
MAVSETFYFDGTSNNGAFYKWSYKESNEFSNLFIQKRRVPEQYQNQ